METVKGPDSRDERIESMVALYQLPLLRLCYAYLHDEELAKDAVQETFIKAYRNRWDDVSPIIFDELNSYLDAFAKSKEADALNTSVGWDDELWKWESKTATVQDLMTLYKSKFDNRKAWLADAISTFPSSQTKGDVNGDTYVDKQDIMVLKDIIKKKRLIYQLSRVDVNGDKKVNVADIVELIKLIRKK